MCGRRLKQRRLLKPAFLRGLKYWGLAKQVCVYAARDLTPRSRDITWYSENLLGGFGEVGGGGYGAIKSASSTHTQRKTRWRPMGHFYKLWYFFNMIFVQHLGPDACSAVRGQQFRAKNIKVTKNIFKHFLELQTFCTVQGHSAVLF